MLQSAEEAVQRGMELLRSHDAPLHRINLEVLDTGHVSRCVLACAYGSYGKGKKALGLTTNEVGAAFGFWYPREFEPRAYYAVLTEVWKQKLQELR